MKNFDQELSTFYSLSKKLAQDSNDVTEASRHLREHSFDLAVSFNAMNHGSAGNHDELLKRAKSDGLKSITEFQDHHFRALCHLGFKPNELCAAVDKGMTRQRYMAGLNPDAFLASIAKDAKPRTPTSIDARIVELKREIGKLRAELRRRDKTIRQLESENQRLARITGKAYPAKV